MPERSHQTTLTFEYETPALADTIERSLEREIGEIDDSRSNTTLDRDGSTVSLTIDAADLVALRAAANTWLSLASVAERTAETVDF
ncbi:MAG: KEOPS complex subunit Pcc1 [Halobacteriales archaeon]